MYKRLDLTQLEGLDLTQDTLDFLQTSYRDAFAGLSLFLGDYVIVTGVTVSGGNYTNGWVCINGELLPLVGGLISPNIIIEEVIANESFGDGNNKPVYYTRTAKLSNSGGTPVSSFVRLKSAKVLTNEVAQALVDIVAANNNANSRVAKAGDTMTGNLIIPNGTIAGHAVNKGQVDVSIANAIAALVNGAPGALDALNELAAAMGNDPNFATTVTNALAGKVAKAGDTMTGALTVPGINTDGVVLRTKVVQIGDWNMDVDAVKSIAHGMADFKKIRGLSGIFRHDNDAFYLPIPLINTSVSTGFDIDYVKFGVITSTTIEVRRLNNGEFDSANYDSVGYNRGWITITYEA